jgi:hypothetical protein
MNLYYTCTLGKDPMLAGNPQRNRVSNFLIPYDRDFMAFPVSLPNDGLMDVTVMPVVCPHTNSYSSPEILF